MQARKFYQNKRLKWFRIYVNYIIEDKKDHIKVNANWWRQDDHTGKFTDMELTQEVMIYKKENDWEPLEDTIEQKVHRHWRPG